jgi:hypothetical protein
MQVNQESFLSLLHTEPERTRLLLKVAGGGALALLVWAAVGKAVVSDVVFLLIDLVAIAAYSTAVAILTGNLVRGADRWQVESAMQARRLLSSPRKAEPAAGDPQTATFDHWYFILRLEDEIKRARRYGSPLSVVILHLGPPGEEPTPAITEKIDYDVAQLAANLAKTMTMPCAIAPLEYAFILPESDRNEARARIAPLMTPLGDYWCRFGISVYPDDATAAEELVQLARRKLDD